MAHPAVVRRDSAFEALYALFSNIIRGSKTGLVVVK
jgi:hypothetical protein